MIEKELSSGVLTSIRQDCAREAIEINFTKLDVNAAIQALEKWWAGNEIAASEAIDLAVVPFMFSSEQKNAVLSAWLKNKAPRFIEEKKAGIVEVAEVKE